MLRRRLWVNKLICFLIFSLFVLTACTNNNEIIQNRESVIFTDVLGREIEVKKNPKRVAALIGSFADVWVLSGGNLCAAAEDAWDDFDLMLEDVKNIGGAHSPSLEALLASNPDFVLASASTSSNVEFKEVLENAGITVAYFDVDCFEDYLFMLDICTDITGRKDLYEKNGISVKNQINKIKSEFYTSDLSEKQRTVLLLRASSGSVKAKSSKGTVLGEMLLDFGCINIADSDKTLLENLSVESITQKEPYHIFVVTMGNDTKKATDNLIKMINQNPVWTSLSAVRENRLHIMDKKLFNIKPNEKWDKAYDKLRQILLKTKQ